MRTVIDASFDTYDLMSGDKRVLELADVGEDDVALTIISKHTNRVDGETDKETLTVTVKLTDLVRALRAYV